LCCHNKKVIASHILITITFTILYSFARSLASIAEGIDFDTVAREWRCKWSVDEEKASLVAAQKAFELVLPELKEVDGIIKVDRVVCGGCKEYKVLLFVWL